MTKRNAILLALAVPFVVRFGMIVIRKSAGNRDTTETEFLLMLLLSAAAGLPFLARGFGPLYAVLISIVYLPLMTWVLVGFSVVVGAGLYGTYP
jgi:hypothetical protein